MPGAAAASGGRRCGSDLLLSLPEDVLELISARLRPRDLCSLALCCRALRAALAASDKAWWLPQCRRAGPPPGLLPSWRAAVPSYHALCRFLSAVAPLRGVWVHQNPELGNVVCVAWGFASVVACRVIPQELGPLGLDAGGPLLWAPVFEILADPDDGSPSRFFLHGRDRDEDSLCPGSVGPIDNSSNVLLLEVDVQLGHPSQPKPRQLLHSQSLATISEVRDPSSSTKRFCRSDTTVPRPSPTPAPAPALLPFSQLPFRDRRRLLDLVAGRVRLKLQPHFAAAPLLPPPSPPPPPPPPGHDGALLLAERRSSLIQLHKINGSRIDRRAAELQSGSMLSHKDRDTGSRSAAQGKHWTFSSVAGCLKDRMRQLIGRSSSPSFANSISKNGSESKHIQLREFLRAGDTIGLCLRASNMRLSTYRAWPNMHDSRFALYKLPLQAPAPGREYAGLWGGTFGWPPGQPSEHRPGKALFFLSLSYEEIGGHLHLIGTKILEGTHYVLHPNGSAMFTVKVDEHASEPFPWEFDGDSLRVQVKDTYNGEGIASGYGFRYPGSKPGLLFVIQNGLLAFVWKESKAVLTLQRLELEELLRKGERVPTLPPIPNFAYLTKSYSNVFVGFPSNSSSSSSPRFD